jgi:hypothetical protein
MRTFAQCVHAFRWQVLRHYNVTAFYVSTVQDEDTASVGKLQELFPGVPVHLDIVSEQPLLPEPEEPVRFEPFARSVPLQAVLRQLWQLERGWALRKEKGGESAIIIRARPDAFFHGYKPEPMHRWLARTPYWGRFGGVNDRFAVLGEDAAAHYFETFKKIPALQAAGCPLHPESLVRASLEDGGCDVSDLLRAEFSTLRKDGEVRSPEISPTDFVNASLG